MPKKSKEAEGQLAIDVLLKEGKVGWGGEEKFKIRRIPFGLEDLDAIIGGGVPRGRVTVLIGAESAGKSFLVQTLIKQAIERGLQVAYLDTEHSYDPIWWKQVGIDLDKVLVAQPTTGEGATDIATALARARVDVVAVDSIAALVPTKEIEESADQSFIALQSRLIARFLRMIVSGNQDSVILCTNQLRETIGGPSPVENMPGGWALRHFNALTLRIRREGWIEEKGKRIGFNMRIVCRKSKVSTPLGECVLPFLFRGEIDVLSLLMDRAIEAGHIVQAGPWYKILEGEESIMGRNSVLDELKGDEALKKRLLLALGDYKEAE